jgi:K+-transporting ATPase KdpF subunit
MSAIILITLSKPIEPTSNGEYAVGVIIAVFIFSYLLYALIKAEKF